MVPAKTPPPAALRRRKKSPWARVRANWVVYLLLVPGFALLLLFAYYPTVTAFVGSVFDWRGTVRTDFVGWSNYEQVLGDPVFWKSVRNVLIWAAWYLTVPFLMPLLVAEAIFNLRSRRWKSFFRMSILVPILVPGIVVTLLWRWIYSSPNGGLNLILDALGLGELARPWLGLTDTALPALLFMNFPWIVGIAPLIILAGLMNISEDVLDSSLIDGCPRWRRVLVIDIPHILPQIRLLLIFEIIRILQNVHVPLALTGGGPSNATMVPGLYLYDKAFGIDRFETVYTRIGEALAVGGLMFATLFVLTFLANRYVRTSGTEYQA